MNLEGEMVINAPRQEVWEALNDPEILARCVDGCERLERVAPNQFAGDLKVQVGPIRAKFRGEILLKDIVPPSSYTLAGSGKGGASGFASGEAKINLVELEHGTLLKYTVTAKVGGKLAQIGGKLIENTAKQHASKFFAKLKEILEPAAQLSFQGGIPEAVEAGGRKRRSWLAPSLVLSVIIIGALAYALVVR